VLIAGGALIAFGSIVAGIYVGNILMLPVIAIAGFIAVALVLGADALCDRRGSLWPQPHWRSRASWAPVTASEEEATSQDFTPSTTHAQPLQENSPVARRNCEG
jgi:hypothetical protein